MNLVLVKGTTQMIKQTLKGMLALMLSVSICFATVGCGGGDKKPKKDDGKKKTPAKKAEGDKKEEDKK